MRHVLPLCAAIIICCFCVSNLSADQPAGVDPSIISSFQQISDRIEAFDSYQYRLINVTVKNKKARRNEMMFYYRKPTAIRIEWIGPKRLRGQIAVYNNGGMKVVPAWLPFPIAVDPDSDMGKGDGNYPIYNSSIGALMRQVISDMSRASNARILEDAEEFIVYEVVNDSNRALIKIDKATGLPLFIEQYDLNGQLVDGGYFSHFESGHQYPDDFFNL
ncbi:MAG: hypothetical protein C4541_00925 [Candidatus Auribacter fodinae]|jgi:outer membrane lipoprotein-sorting protein|uniref:Outer membrane lipoprotein carrier protein LolA n=1 Tax=Candidatus Auribacter fodinae TaxID=2093366 RepID=A0A3A4RGV1_9BACT|nr:MAG: hypothetical protein C4541_00925 [Candidatus Auribacter fodinae]